MSFLIDTHIHLDAKEFMDRDADLVKAQQNNIQAWILPATVVERFKDVKAVSQNNNAIFPAYGLHPYFMDRHQREHIAILEEWIINENPIAIGECGLDNMIENPQFEKQIYFFQAQVKLAKKYDLPLIIHSRKSLDQVLKLLRQEQGTLRGVIHGFSGSLQQAEQAVELGFYIGFGGACTFDRATRLQSILKTIPSDSYLLETDAPYQPSSALERGAIHYPQDLIHIAKKVAIIRNESLAEVTKASYNNSVQLFNLDL